MNVLVIEWEQSVCDNLVAQLGQLPAVKWIRSACSETAAEELLSTFAADVVFIGLQMPGNRALRLLDRAWPGPIPLIVCITPYEGRIVSALQTHGVEYLVRPFSSEILAYAATLPHRQYPVDPRENFIRLMAMARDLGVPPGRNVFAFRKGAGVTLETDDVGAIHYLKGNYFIWTPDGVWEINQSSYLRIMQRLRMDRFYRNGPLRSPLGYSLQNFDRARRWLRWHALLDLVLSRPAMPDPIGFCGSSRAKRTNHIEVRATGPPPI
jgi:DNA-binding response OmpR family regulator